MLENRDTGRTLRLNDDILQVLKGKTIAEVSYKESEDGRSEVIRVTLDNGFSLTIESGNNSTDGDVSYLYTSIEKDS